MSPALYSIFFVAFIVLSVNGERYKSEEAIHIEIRQEFSCNNNSDCYSNATVPSSLVECFSSVCRCMECFERGSDGRCTIEFPTCYFYNSGTLSCQDDRRSQLVAFLLSLFLSGVGAANFYIGQTGLAAGQLTLFIAVMLITCFAACIPCCVMCCVMGDEAKGSIFAICFFLLVFVILFGCALSLFAWWIADAVIFGTNARDSGDGCPLKPF